MEFGGHPANRQQGLTPLIQAPDDYAAAKSWLDRYQRSPNTFRAYEREVSRLLGWMRLNGLALNQLKAEDATSYLRLLSNPPTALVGKKQVRSSDQWRPLNKPLSEKSLNHVRTVLTTFYRFLNDAKYLTGNPFALSERINLATEPMDRYLEMKLWQRFMGFLATELPAQSGVTPDHAERCLWIFTLLYHSGARIGELSDCKMGDFHERSGKWWLRLRGKGKKVEDVPVSNLLLSALHRYRMFHKLSPFPALGETMPAVFRIKGEGGSLSATAFHKIIKQVFQRFADVLSAQGEPELAKHVAGMSAHWVRHTTASHQLQSGIPLLQVSKNLRHSDISTTTIYTHEEKEVRHDAMLSFGKGIT